MDLKSLIQGEDSVQKLVASGSMKEALRLVVPEAREAIEQEVVPLIEDMVTTSEVLRELVEDVQSKISTGFKIKDETYTRLIRYKSIDQSDDQFEKALDDALHDWSLKTRKLLDNGDSEGSSKPDSQEVTIKIKVEVDNPASGEDPDVSLEPEPSFEINDVRL